MLVAQVLPYVRTLATRKLADEEVIEDVQFLKDELGEKFESLT
jgi:V-type H+-transporting ATPase subunit H